MGFISSVLGLGSEFEHKGRKYILAPWSYGIMGQFERYLEDEAFAALQRATRLLPPAEKAEQLARLTRDIASGVYSFGSELVSQAMNSNRHFAHLLWLCLKPAHPEITIDTVREMIEEGMEKLVSKMGQANSDPTTGAPAPTSPSSPPTSAST